MEKKINIAELLKDCPKGTKLYSPLCGECEFDRVNYGTIICKKRNTQEITFTSEGYYMLPVFDDSEPVLFPSKENRDWSKFQKTIVPKFKVGDKIVKKNGISVPVEITSVENKYYYSEPNTNGSVGVLPIKDQDDWELVNDIIKPKFKVGDRLVNKNVTMIPIEIIGVRDKYYWFSIGTTTDTLPIDDQDNWKLIPDKFDISTLTPFDKVLVRDDNERCWNCELFDSYRRDEHYPFFGIAACYKQCIPYKNNEHLLGTTNDCDEYYKNW